MGRVEAASRGLTGVRELQIEIRKNQRVQSRLLDATGGSGMAAFGRFIKIKRQTELVQPGRVPTRLRGEHILIVGCRNNQWSGKIRATLQILKRRRPPQERQSF